MPMWDNSEHSCQEDRTNAPEMTYIYSTLWVENIYDRICMVLYTHCFQTGQGITYTSICIENLNVVRCSIW